MMPVCFIFHIIEEPFPFTVLAISTAGFPSHFVLFECSVQFIDIISVFYIDHMPPKLLETFMQNHQPITSSVFRKSEVTITVYHCAQIIQLILMCCAFPDRPFASFHLYDYIRGVLCDPFWLPLPFLRRPEVHVPENWNSSRYPAVYYYSDGKYLEPNLPKFSGHLLYPEILFQKHHSMPP